MANESVSDTGPILHLNEIDLLSILKIFNIIIPLEVKEELNKYGISLSNKIFTKKLNSHYKDISQLIMDNYSLDLGESEAIALALQEKINIFLTDDLDARIVANKYEIETHGSIGIILRAFREKLITREEAINKVKELHDKSSLFITKDLINYVINEIKRFKK